MTGCSFYCDRATRQPVGKSALPSVLERVLETARDRLFFFSLFLEKKKFVFELIINATIIVSISKGGHTFPPRVSAIAVPTAAHRPRWRQGRIR